jgi:hypothetical protein
MRSAGTDTQGLAHPSQDPAEGFEIEPVLGIVIQKPKGLGPDAEQIVRIHGHAIPARGFVPAQPRQNLCLGADPVRGKSEVTTPAAIGPRDPGSEKGKLLSLARLNR